ncbi:hypothetical protein [Streptomyces sp. NPDC059224]|uniref:hypothetical protein n=1 Tax=Streptomyces sp. NPDC059224 TaxID=3346775 RepID=UPI00367CD05E
MSDGNGWSGNGTEGELPPGQGPAETPPDQEEPSTQRWPTVTPLHTGVPENPWQPDRPEPPRSPGQSDWPPTRGSSRQPERPVSLRKPERADPAAPGAPLGRQAGHEAPYAPGREPSAEQGRPARPPTPPPGLPSLPAGFSSPSSSPTLPAAPTPPGARRPVPSPGGAPRSYTPPPWSADTTSSGQRLAATPPPAGYTPRRRSGRALAAVVGLVLVAGLSGLGVWYFGRDGGGGSGTGADPSVSARVSAESSAPGSREPTASPSPRPTPSVAAGYRVVDDPVGYTLDVPQGWVRRQRQGEKAPVVYYDSPSDGRQLQIFAVSEATPAESLDLAENDPGYGYAKQPGYQPGARTSGDTWAELSYRYDDQDKGPRQVVDHRFQAADGTLYAIRASGPGSLAADLVRGPLTTALDSFCPAGARCS